MGLRRGKRVVTGAPPQCDARGGRGAGVVFLGGGGRPVRVGRRIGLPADVQKPNGRNARGLFDDLGDEVGRVGESADGGKGGGEEEAGRRRASLPAVLVWVWGGGTPMVVTIFLLFVCSFIICDVLLSMMYRRL